MPQDSEVTHLMQQIELECQATKQELEGLAVVASHNSINARMERIWNYRLELAREVGEQEATKIMCTLDLTRTLIRRTQTTPVPT